MIFCIICEKLEMQVRKK